MFSHPVYLFLREFSLQDFRGGSIHIRGIEGHVVVEDDFSEVYRKIKEISPRVNNTGEGVSEGSGCASGCCN
ncbi:hypothetical protein [Escherichia coli]|uniref:hypothetical protein n=1 Tax=Escherichia coli TaxID=562 RepID=UPI001FF3CF4E|nr:hypothetical protein [Escherichia coli]